MAVDDIVPSGDSSVAWQTTGTPHADEINEDKGSPNESDYIFASQVSGDHGKVDDFHMTSIVGVDEVTSITVWVYMCGAETYGGRFEIDLYNGATWEGYQPRDPFESFPDFSWVSITFSGLSMTQGNLDACRIRFRADISVSKQQTWCACTYAAVTYTPAGWTHKIQGIANANIAKVMGISKANIAKISGV